MNNFFAQVQLAIQRVTEEVNDEVICPKTKVNTSLEPKEKKSASPSMDEFLLDDKKSFKSYDSHSHRQYDDRY